MGTAARALRVTTRCRSIEEYVAAFALDASPSSLVVRTTATRPVGARYPFVVALVDGSAALRGEAEVIETVPGRRMRLKLLALDGASRDVHEQMLQLGGGRSESPRPSAKGRRPMVRVPTPLPGQRVSPDDAVVLLPAWLRPTARCAAVIGAPPSMPVPVPLRLEGTPRVVNAPRVVDERDLATSRIQLDARSARRRRTLHDRVLMAVVTAAGAVWGAAVASWLLL